MKHPGGFVVLIGASILAGLGLAAPFSVASPVEAEPSAPTGQPPPQVIVSAQKFNRRTLEHVIIPRFVRSHGALSPVIAQVGRWHTPVCVRVAGLRSRFGELVARRVEEVARSVGAPTVSTGKKCVANVEIVFTGEPQKLIDHVAKKYRGLLGYYEETHLKQTTTIDRPIQAWYVTGTRPMNGYQGPAGTAGSISNPRIFSAQVDSQEAELDGYGVSGTAGNHLNRGLTSEFLHALVIVNAASVSKLPLGAVSDYVAMVALTRLQSLDACSELPSIIDLLSRDCGAETNVRSITTADIAFLKALYGADLEANLNVERGDMRHRMVAVIEPH